MQQDVHHPQPALPGAVVQDPVVQVQVLLGLGDEVQARRRVPVEAAVELPVPAGLLWVRSSVRVAQHEVAAQPAHRVLVQRLLPLTNVR